eukprot:TRINITY_DN14963_c0_g2_i2.p1 TRINITY_DN14963_c0_g2~~TRINITY_DN14963_c0_g2_i2.p1  ORF type:complete len:504 (+),score=36.83 TRINITY_DN14963_c0_g2_i2:63-1574(+)
MTPWILLLFSLLASECGALVVPLSLHERSTQKGRSFLSIANTAQSQLEYFRARHNNTHAIEYSGQVQVGGQRFTVIFDTGSDQLILPGLDCVSAACKKHRAYDPSKSRNSSNLSMADARQCQFGAGSVMGYERADDVCFGESCAPVVFVEALVESDDPFLHASFDGVLGLSLALRKNATVKTSVLEALVASKSIPQAIFAVFLAKDFHSSVSELSIGEVNAERMAGSTHWVSLSEPGYWQFSLKGITVGGKELVPCPVDGSLFVQGTNISSFLGTSSQGKTSPTCCSTLAELEWEDRCQFWGNSSDTDDDGTPRSRSRFTHAGVILQDGTDGRLAVRFDDGCVQNVPRKWVSMEDGCRGDGSIQAVVDTGSSLMMAPEPLAARMLASLGVKENCTSQDTEHFPSMTFTLPTGDALTLTAADYMDTVVAEDGVFCWPHIIPMPTTAKGPVLVLGMPFLRTYYTIFDAENQRLGFAEPKQPPSVVGSERDISHSVRLRGVRPGES